MRHLTSLIAVLLVCFAASASVGGRSSVATFNAGEDQETHQGVDLPVPPWPLVDVTIQLSGDVTYSVAHVPTLGMGAAAWLTGKWEGGEMRPLKCRVAVAKSEQFLAVVELQTESDAIWNLLTGGTAVAFAGVESHPAVVIENMPAWDSPLAVKVDFERPETSATINVNGTTDFDLTQIVTITVTEAD
ncbi:MAG TPA: hypothetical protein VNA25_07900 [Phycisphaerae bacterium]|nr:hypothetical protein [Phycisphaerae bacterium]